LSLRMIEPKAHNGLKRIQAVIMTTSSAEEDILKSYGLQANCYITKPIQLDQFLKVVKSMQDSWLSIVVLPPNEAKK
jgi:chemotaxis family two-component system response regulator Rcp1